ncbi:uncharacterized protein LOC131676262 [Topomyia yanbarensis]|uniref:uncharacterized protein LOC131676262 n=1 Tax=Topomyia yanbarensis TaxID=2498891 RepID=UPI00273CC27A|nr:uncharacterized protein LOC131676262 [Topomyia yanbarensis]
MLKRTRAQRKIYPNVTIDQIPDSLILEIFRRLPQSAILPATLVCRRWCTLISSNSLLDSFTLTIKPNPNEDLYREYQYYLSRSERKYRKAEVGIHDQRSLLVAVIALRRFGQYLTELELTLEHCNYSTYFQLHFERMKELEMGMEELDRMLWAQEVDSYDRCLKPIAQLADDMEEMPEANEIFLDFRRIEEVFLPFVYRNCFRLKKLLISQPGSLWYERTNVLFYEGVEMENLMELEVHGTDVIILADCPKLRSFSVHGITTGKPFYYGLSNAFPKLSQLEIINDCMFNDQCMCVISGRAMNLEQLTLSFTNNTVSQQSLRYLQRLKQLRKLSIMLKGRYQRADFLFENWPHLPIEKLFIAFDELPLDCIREILLRSDNLVEFEFWTERRIAYSTWNKLQQIRPGCQLTYYRR